MNPLQNLQRIKNRINQRQQMDTHPYDNYIIPSCWRSITPPFSVLSINPYVFYLGAMERILSMSPVSPSQSNHSSSLGSVYALFVRAGLAFDHQETTPNVTSKGTFLKAIATLPLYQSMGIKTLVLLPIFAHAKHIKKGNAGSPYATIDWHQIEPDLWDPIAGPDSSVEEQFQAFVEAAHHLGMKVLLDFAPRTCSRESKLILRHPDWFYWIKTQDLAQYQAPTISSLPPFTLASPKVSHLMYESEEVPAFLNQFCLDPATQYPSQWNDFVKNQSTSASILSRIDEKFGLTTAPAFADVINDPQPPWNDITYLRFYYDAPLHSPNEYHKKAPYLFYDVAKASLNPGRRPNRLLWKYLSNVLPTMIHRFQIDGARIDMGHALPDELTDLIIHKARKINPNFVFLSEEMNPEHLAKTKRQGYNFSLGKSFFMMHEMDEFSLHEWAYNTSKLALPTIAASETHDTPRISARCQEEAATFLLAISHFVPNTIPWINGGQELGETIPMNQGLAFSNQQQPPSLMALFDDVYYNYRRPTFATHVDLLQRIYHFKQSYSIDWNSKNVRPLGFLHMREPAIGFIYPMNAFESLFLVAHTASHNGRIHARLQEAFPHQRLDLTSIQCVFVSKGTHPEPIWISNELIGFDCESYQVSIYHILHSPQ